MNAWLATIGEPVPVQEGSHDRLHRAGYFARFLPATAIRSRGGLPPSTISANGTSLTATPSSRPRVRCDIRLLHGCGYRSNVSWARFRDHDQIGGQFARLARAAEDRPDVIVAALPTIELCAESVKFGRQRGIPVILDMRDMWPDIFVTAVPGRPAGARLLLWPLFRQARSAHAGATAITGITEAFVDWGLQRGRRARSPLDRAFPMGYASVPPAEENLRRGTTLGRAGAWCRIRRPIACFSARWAGNSTWRACWPRRESSNPAAARSASSSAALATVTNTTDTWPPTWRTCSFPAGSTPRRFTC